MKASKVIIMCAGSGTRWGNYLGVPKQMIPVDGEPLLKRTIRLLRKNGIKNIYVTVPKIGEFGDIDAIEIVGKSDTELHKFLNAKELAGSIFLWGDTFFTEKAIKTICRNKKPLMFFGRFTGSEITGKRYGEIFAVKTTPEFFAAAEELQGLR
jgi:choline kinase